ncbi:hypothetical protein OA90_26930, partial [Labrenzia sp. OB1]
RIALDNGTILTPKLGLSGVWNFDVGRGAASQAGLIGDDDLRARADMGFTAMNPVSGIHVSISGHYDGIGIPEYNTWGGKLRLTLPIK